jgi:hypothetical protein
MPLALPLQGECRPQDYCFGGGLLWSLGGGVAVVSAGGVAD